jgi:hypothetical protein
VDFAQQLLSYRNPHLCGKRYYAQRVLNRGRHKMDVTFEGLDLFVEELEMQGFPSIDCAQTLTTI